MSVVGGNDRRSKLRLRFAIGLLAAVLALFSGAASASAAPIGTITEFSAGLSATSDPDGIVAGPDGNIWFTESFGGRIGRMTPTGTVTEFPLSAGSTPRGIAAGPDGNLWFTEAFGGNPEGIGRITPTGTVTEFPLSAGSDPHGIAAGPDGNLWFTELGGDRIGRITPTGTVTEFPVSAGGTPTEIAAGPDGNLWFTEYYANRIGRITPTGTVTEFPVSTSSFPEGIDGIAAGPDGNLWFTETNESRIGRITPTGQITEFSTGITGFGPSGIAAGPDGNLWFTEQTARIGRITPTGQITEFSTGITSPAGPGIAAGPDGNLWFTELEGDRIGQIIDGAPLLGDPKLESRVDHNDAGMAEAFATQVGHDGAVSSLALYVDPSSTASKIVVGIYSDRHGHPGTREGQATITNVLPGNWNLVNIPSIAVTAGQRVWVAVLRPRGGGTIRFRDTAGGHSETSAQRTLTQLPATWSTGDTFTDGPLAAYGN